MLRSSIRRRSCPTGFIRVSPILGDPSQSVSSAFYSPIFVLLPHIGQCLVQIRDYIVGVFDADRDPDQAVGYSEPVPFLLWNRSVSHSRWMADQSLDSTQRLA